MNIYQGNGYKDRLDYLKYLADDYGYYFEVVQCLADCLGEDEDTLGNYDSSS